MSKINLKRGCEENQCFEPNVLILLRELLRVVRDAPECSTDLFTKTANQMPVINPETNVIYLEVRVDDLETGESQLVYYEIGGTTPVDPGDVIPLSAHSTEYIKNIYEKLDLFMSDFADHASSVNTWLTYIEDAILSYGQEIVDSINSSSTALIEAMNGNTVNIVEVLNTLLAPSVDTVGTSVYTNSTPIYYTPTAAKSYSILFEGTNGTYNGIPMNSGQVISVEAGFKATLTSLPFKVPNQPDPNYPNSPRVIIIHTT